MGLGLGMARAWVERKLPRSRGCCQHSPELEPPWSGLGLGLGFGFGFGFGFAFGFASGFGFGLGSGSGSG